MTPFRFSLLCVLAVSAAGCKDEATFTEPIPPLAAIHWVHAVPDTGAMDYRPVDIVSNAGLFDAAFRGSNMFYQGIEAGSRRIRVFMSSADPAITSVPIVDTSLALTADNGYTLIHTGFARGGPPARAVLVVPDNPTAPAAGDVGIRVIHAGSGLGGVDVNVTRRATDTLPDAPLVGNVAYGTAGTYLAVARDSVAADTLRVVVTATGTKAPVLVNLRFPTGTAGTSTSNPIAGARVPGSVMTAVVVPASVAGSQAPQGGAFANPSAVVLVDRRPPNTVIP